VCVSERERESAVARHGSGGKYAKNTTINVVRSHRKALHVFPGLAAVVTYATAQKITRHNVYLIIYLFAKM